jgi:hypothetical protein
MPFRALNLGIAAVISDNNLNIVSNVAVLSETSSSRSPKSQRGQFVKHVKVAHVDDVVTRL